jgi:serine/threonine protein kinase
LPGVDADRNLLFGLMARQTDAITRDQFVDACALWANWKERTVGEILVERGWLTPEDRADVDRFVDRRLARHGGDVRASVADLVARPPHVSLAAVEDTAVGHTLAGLIGSGDLARSHGSPPAAHHEQSEPIQMSTIGLPRDSRDRYTLNRLHARGGIGQVWLARDPVLGRDVALKELRPDQADDPLIAARFVHEAQVTGQLEHPGIVPVYELAGKTGYGVLYSTMRFIRRRTLSEAVRAYHQERQDGRPSALEHLALVSAFVNVCQAVAFAHSKGVIHRDLKGQNAVVGDFGEVVLLDWGLANVLGRDDSVTRTVVRAGVAGATGETLEGQVLGTPGYMAPEQAQGRLDVIDRRTDVYGLGAILFEILTGQPPFCGESVSDVLRRVVHEPPVRPRSLNPAAPAALEAICLKALAKDAQTRYDSALELAAEVQRYLADEPVQAYREPRTRRLGRWMKRYRTLVVGAATLLVTASIALAVNNAIVRSERDGAEAARAQAEANLGIARLAVKDLVQRAVDHGLESAPRSEGVRVDLADRTHLFSLGFLARKPADRSIRIDAGLDLERLADLELMVGNGMALIEAIRAIRILVDDRPVSDALGVDQPKVSALTRGKLEEFSIDRLFRFLGA